MFIEEAPTRTQRILVPGSRMAVIFRRNPYLDHFSRMVIFAGRWPYLAVCNPYFFNKLLTKTVNNRMGIFCGQSRMDRKKKKKKNVTYGFPGCLWSFKVLLR